MSQAPFRVGVIGAGGVARQFHLPGWRSLPGVSVAAIADVNRAAAVTAAMEHSIPHVFTDVSELVKLDLDAVDVCAPNRVHAEAVTAALEAGKHVLCEKPLATTAAEVRRMGELADAKGLILMTAQHYRFSSPAMALKAWAGEGRLGPAYHARVRAMRRATLPVSPGFIDRALSGGGPCMDIGVHALDICLWLMGFPKALRVTGAAKVNFAKGYGIPGMWGEWNRELFSVEDFAAGFIHFEGGATMTLETAWLGHQVEKEDLSCQVFGKNGGVQWPSAEFATVQGGTLVQGSLTHPRRIEQPHFEVLSAFRDAVVARAPSPVPWRETLEVIAILEAIYRSEEAGREVEIRL